MKYQIAPGDGLTDRSPPSRGAWIEIGNQVILPTSSKVAPLTGGVD